MPTGSHYLPTSWVRYIERAASAAKPLYLFTVVLVCAALLVTCPVCSAQRRVCLGYNTQGFGISCCYFSWFSWLSRIMVPPSSIARRRPLLVIYCSYTRSLARSVARTLARKVVADVGPPRSADRSADRAVPRAPLLDRSIAPSPGRPWAAFVDRPLSPA